MYYFVFLDFIIVVVLAGLLYMESPVPAVSASGAPPGGQYTSNESGSGSVSIPTSVHVQLTDIAIEDPCDREHS